MSEVKIIGAEVPNVPWQERPKSQSAMLYGDTGIIRLSEEIPWKVWHVSSTVRSFPIRARLSGYSGENRSTGFLTFIWEKVKMGSTGILKKKRFGL